MSFKSVFAVLLFVGLLVAEVSAQNKETPNDDTQVIQEHVESLGDPSFRKRQQAVDAIREIGMRAEPTLLENLRHPKLEVRLRVSELLSEIKLNDLQRRIEALISFRADGDELDLPGWSPFVELVGDNKATRNLYAKMIKEEFPLLQLALEDEETRAAKLTEAVRLQNSNNQQTVEVGTYAAYLFLGCLQEKSDPNLVSYIYSASHRQPVSMELREGSLVEPLHSMLDTFLVRADERYANLILNLAVELNLKSGIKFAVSYLEGAQQQSDYQTRVAIMCLGKFGDQSHLPILEQLFGDERKVRVYLNGKQRDAQIRDFALAACLFVTEQSLRDYQVVTYPEVDRKSITGSLNVGFSDDKDREPAFEKWAKFRATLPKDAETPEDDSDTPDEEGNEKSDAEADDK